MDLTRGDGRLGTDVSDAEVASDVIAVDDFPLPLVDVNGGSG